MKKMRRNILFGVVMLGTVLAGTNSASAGYIDNSRLESEFFAPFNDANGNRVSLNKEYYMEPVDLPGHGINYGQWSTNEWVKLGSGRGMAVKFENELYDELRLNSLVKIKTDRYNIKWSIGDGSVNVIPQKRYIYLGAGFNAEGVELHELVNDQKNQYWIPIQFYSPELASTNTIAFKNEEKNKFLSYRNSNAWLYLDQPTINSTTKWRLIPKQ